MVTEKSVYVASDGSRWDHPNQAIARDNLDVAVQEIEATFPAPPNDPDVRIAVDPDIISAAKRNVVELCRIMFPHESVFQFEPDLVHPMGYAGRFLSENNCGPLNRVWYRFCCYRDGYLYNQPFYALNPHAFTGRTA
jgi:hypothetical protein